MTIAELIKATQDSQFASLHGVAGVLNMEIRLPDNGEVWFFDIKEDPSSEGDYVVFITDVAPWGAKEKQ